MYPYNTKQATEYPEVFGSFKFDVADTLGRAVSALLSKGVSIELGENACTDCDSKIYLPQAMRRYLSSREIDLVRYVVAHEQAHITHSQIDVLRDIASQDPPDIANSVFQSLEDIRIEAAAMADFFGHNRTFELGRSIALEEWESFFDPHSLNQCIVALIYGGHICPDLRHAATDNSDENGLLPWVDSIISPFYARIESVADHKRFPRTGSLGSLHADIFLALKNALKSEGLPPPIENLVKKRKGKSQKELSNEDLDLALSPDCRTLQGNLAGGGMAETVVRKSLRALSSDESESGFAEERITKEAIGQRSRGFGLRMGDGFGQEKPDPAASEKNYQYGRHCAGMCQQLIDRLRGTSRKGYTKPKSSGLRIAAKQIPKFILGETLNVLRRRNKQPHMGTACMFLVDDSGSMRHDRSRSAWRAAATLALACERANFACSIIRYSSSWRFVKTFSQSCASVRKMFAMAESGGTRLDEPMRESVGHLSVRHEDKKFLFILTDGHTGRHQRQAKLARDAGIRIIPILLGDQAAEHAGPDGDWFGFDCIVLPDDTVSIGPPMIEKLVAYL